MDYNLSIISPSSWIHYSCMNEVVMYFYHMMKKNGKNIEINFNRIEEKKINIIFFAYNLPLQMKLPKNTIIFQSEDMDQTAKEFFVEHNQLKLGKAYIDLLNSFPVIDYSKVNLEAIHHKNKAYLPLLYCEELKYKFDRNVKDFLLFYGALTDYRKSIFSTLKKNKLKILSSHEPWTYGFIRDKRLSESIALLNLHKVEKVNKFESVRCFYSLINEVPVITEKFHFDKNDYYKNCVYILDDLSEESFDKSVEETKNCKKFKEKIELFKSYNGKEIFKKSIESLSL